VINFVKHRRWYYLLSTLVIGAGIIAMVISTQTYPERSVVRLSIDFVGGTLFEVNFTPIEGQTPGEITGSALEQLFDEAGLSDITAQRLGLADNLRWQVRASFVGEVSELVEDLSERLQAFAATQNVGFDETFFNENLAAVSPTVGQEVTNAAVVATAVASLLVLSWIAFAFRMVKHSWRYGICALLAMLHDVLVMAGAMSILGLLVGWQADALFLTGLLTIVGFSVQDTIVVFDRIRENDVRRRGEPYELIVNRSLLETIQRSLMTQVAVLFVLVSLFLVGSGPIHQFVGILAIGLISGSYSSIFIAVPLLVSWDRGEFPFFIRRRQSRVAA
jgi:preprotein translocase SecF subunit